MAEQVFCIDLGSAYAKVGLRPARRANSDVLTDPLLSTQDELRICIPTTVAVDYSAVPPRPVFGDAALEMRPGKTQKIYANWKKGIFAEAVRLEKSPLVGSREEPAVRTPSRLESLLRSKEFLKFAGRYGVHSGEVAALHRLFDGAAAILHPPSNGKPDPAESPADSDAFKIAVLFFRHLRKTVLDICCKNRPNLANPESIPARLTVPAFAPEHGLPAHPGCRWLAEALRRAGWSPASHRPIISEPYANAIGVLTRGSNCTRERDMLQRGLLATCLANQKDHPDYRVVVIDVGAYTVDFAVLTYRTGGAARTLDEVEFERQELSVPLGVTELDSAVLGAIPHRQAVYLREQAAPIEWVDFRPRVYIERQTFPTPEGEVGAGGDEERVEAVIREYGERLNRRAREFASCIPDVPFKELILTGGGSSIPAVQDALIGGVESVWARFRKVHLPRVDLIAQSRQSTPQQPVVLLEGKLTRGATALGGSSFFFDMDREPYPLPA